MDDVWAEYGQAHKRPEYKLLQDVTHRTPEEVEREENIKAREHIRPSHTLNSNFAEILKHFEFKDFHQESPQLTDEGKKQIIDIWKVIVGVQQHFNEIEMRIRALFVTILLALLASIGFLMDKKLSFLFGSLTVQFATFLPLAGVLGTCLFYFIDRYWYHRLLLGSVNQARFIELKHRDEIPELSLTDAIAKESPYEPKSWLMCFAARLVVTEKRYKDTGRLHSDGKIELFYKTVIIALLLASALIAMMGGVTFTVASVWL